MSKTTTSGAARKPPRRMTDEEVEEAARSDPDAQPLSAEYLARMKPTPRSKIIRRVFGLTQEQFSACFRIPIGTVRDWEQGISDPDAAARAYLIVIAMDPIGVCKAFVVAPSPEDSRAANHHNLAVVYAARGDLTQAEAQFRKALLLARKIGDSAEMARQHVSLAGLQEKQGDTAKACRHWRKARDLFADAGCHEMVGQVERALRKAGCARG